MNETTLRPQMPSHAREHDEGGRDPLRRLTLETPTVFTANVNNWAPPNYPNATMFRVAADAARDLTGITQPSFGGRIIYLHNVAAYTITLKDESASSDASNRFALQADYPLLTDKAVLLQYDNVSFRWRMIPSDTAALLPVSPASLTKNENDYNPTGLPGAGVIRLTSDSSGPWKLTGLTAPTVPDLRFVVIYNVDTADPIIISDEDTGSAAANRFALANGNVTLLPDATIILQYDATTPRWRQVGGAGYIQDSHGVDVQQDTAAQAITTVTATAVTWNAETKDSDAYHSTSSNTSRLTIPAGLGGWYVITAGVQWKAEVHGGTFNSLWLAKNGGQIPGTRIQDEPVILNYATDGLFQSTSKAVYLVAGDYVEAFVYHDAGANLQLNSTANVGGMSAVLVSK